MKSKKIMAMILATAMLATMCTGVSAASPESVLYKYDIELANTQPIVLSQEANTALLNYLNSKTPNSPFVSTLSTRSQVVLSPEEFFELLFDSGIVDEEFLNDMKGRTIEIRNPTGLASIGAVSKKDQSYYDARATNYTRTDSNKNYCLACGYVSVIKLMSSFTSGTDSYGSYQDNTSNSISNVAQNGGKRMQLSNDNMYSDGRTYTSGNVSSVAYEYDYSCDHDTNFDSLATQSNPVR